MEKFGFTNRRVLVTGATGFIGTQLVERLNGEGADVAVFVLDEENGNIFWQVKNPIYRGNIQNFSDIQRAIVRFQPEYIFHLAAQPLVDTALRETMDTLNTNIQGSQNLLHACLDIRDKLESIIFVSTDKVYGNFLGAVDESFPLAGTNHPYNASKVCADVLAQMYKSAFQLPVAIVRSGNVYGEGDLNWDRLIPGVSRWIIRNEEIEIRSNGNYMRDYIYVGDVVDAYLLLAHEGFQGAINLGAENAKSVKDIVKALSMISEKNPVVTIKNNAKHEIPYQHLNWFKANSLGWYPKTPLEEGLKRTYEWYKEYLS